MNRLDFAGASYCDALPDGRFVRLYMDWHIETSWAGRVNLPGENVLYLRLGVNGHLCGQGGISGIAWEWDGTAWRNRGLAPGQSPCIFDNAGNLHITAAQGYRYCAPDGTLVTGDDTLNDGRRVALELGLKKIWQFSHFDGVTIGQGDTPTCCLTISPFGRRVLEPGNCEFVRVTRRGDRFAVAMVRPGFATFFWFDVSELANLPLETPVIVPPIDPPVDPPVEPHPEPSMKLPAEVQDALRAFVAKFPVPQGLPPGDGAKAVMRPYMKRAAEYVEFKTDDNYGVKSTSPGSDQSGDALAQPRQNRAGWLWIWDIFTGTGTGNPQLNLNADSEPDEHSNQHFIPVTPKDHVGGGTTQPPDVPPTQPPADAVTRAELEAALSALSFQLSAKIDEVERDLQHEIDKLEDAQMPTDVVRESTHKVTTSVNLLGRRDFDGTIVRKT